MGYYELRYAVVYVDDDGNEDLYDEFFETEEAALEFVKESNEEEHS